MYGYKVLAESYRKVLTESDDTIDRADLEFKIKILDIMANLSEAEILFIFDTGAYNDVLKAYCRTALKNCNINADTISDVMNEIKHLLSEKTASDILNV